MRPFLRLTAFAAPLTLALWTFPGCSPDGGGDKMDSGAMPPGKTGGAMDKGKMEGGMDKGKMEGAMPGGKMDGGMDKGKMDGAPE